MIHRTTSAVMLLLTASSAKPYQGTTKYALSNDDGRVGANCDFCRPQVIYDTTLDYNVVDGNAKKYMASPDQLVDMSKD